MKIMSIIGASVAMLSGCATTISPPVPQPPYRPCWVAWHKFGGRWYEWVWCYDDNWRPELVWARYP